MPHCHLPALAEAICSGSRRAAARISAQVSSTVECDGVPACMLEDTMTPALVQAGTSICG